MLKRHGRGKEKVKHGMGKVESLGTLIKAVALKGHKTYLQQAKERMRNLKTSKSRQLF